ncbi:hypothetical protein [Hyphomicrobium sp. 2TAF46]|uniref:hypothetical protein n=1 Tax=Hyphomicrobium sp. 2TAF46 TaxID=3233019 RepID=UPI003F8FF642
MQEIDLSRYSDHEGFTLVFQGASLPFDWKTLEETMKGLRQAAKAIGEIVDPDFEIDIEIGGITPGSVKLKVTFRKKLKDAAGAALVGVLVTQTAAVPHDYVGALLLKALYDRSSPQAQYEVSSTEETVTTVSSDASVTMLHDAFRLVPKVKKNRKVQRGVRRVLSATQHNDNVTGIGFSLSNEDKVTTFSISKQQINHAIGRPARIPADYIPKGTFLTNNITLSIGNPKDREVVNAQIYFTSPVRGRPNTWRCVWDGKRITVTITDPHYLATMESNFLRGGSNMNVELTIYRKFSRTSQTWVNKAYEITKVYTQGIGRPTEPFTFGDPYNALPPPKNSD